MIISLIGFMGAGKTTTGAQLAKTLKCPFVDLDSYIEKKEGKTITEIFEEGGEASFRTLEENSLQDVLENHISEHPETLEDADAPKKVCTLVLSLGGGIVTNPAAAELISRFTYCIYIKTDIETILQRLEDESSSRPMLSGEGSLREKIEKLYYEREPLYRSLAKKII